MWQFVCNTQGGLVCSAVLGAKVIVSLGQTLISRGKTKLSQTQSGLVPVYNSHLIIPAIQI